MSNQQNRLDNESEAHFILKERAANYLREKGYSVLKEYRVHIKNSLYIVDVVGFKNGKSVAIECGNTSKSKIEKLKKVFNIVKRFYYNSRLNPMTSTREKLLQKGWQKRYFINLTLLKNTKLYSDGKTQVPRKIIEELNLRPGSQIVWVAEGGKIHLESARQRY